MVNKTVLKSYISIQSTNHTMIWGNKYFDINHFITENKISHAGYCEQFHSNILIESTKEINPKCDAIFTNKNDYALVIKTADCVPVLVKHEEYIFALHAGWRGLCNEILLNLNAFKPSEKTKAYIGPHISYESYEVGAEVIEQFTATNPELEKIKDEFIIPSKNKYLLNLKKLTTWQLIKSGIPADNIQCEDIDTLTSSDWHSFRRDKEKAGRNLSLIFKHS